MSSVLIEGTLLPAAGVLKRGEQATVAYTDRIQRLVQGGHIKIVEFYPDEDDAPVEVEETSEEGGHELVQESEAVEPKRNASLSEWQQFFTDQDLQYPAEAGRDDLVAAWTNIKQQRAGGS